MTLTLVVLQVNWRVVELLHGLLNLLVLVLWQVESNVLIKSISRRIYLLNNSLIVLKFNRFVNFFGTQILQIIFDDNLTWDVNVALLILDRHLYIWRVIGYLMSICDVGEGYRYVFIRVT